MMRILYIHGANSTPTSFNYIREGLPEHDAHLFQYSTAKPAMNNLVDLFNQITDYTTPFSIVAHSMGGLFAVLLGDSMGRRIENIITMSTPFGGCNSALLLSRWVKHQLLVDIAPRSEFIKTVRKTRPRDRVTNVITTEGRVPLMPEPNDGMVTIRSQDSLHYGERYHLPYNHSEILQAPETRSLIKSLLFV